MKSAVTDIDIDVPDRDKVLELFPHTPAAKHDGDKETKHNTGVYFHDVPIDPLNNRCTIDYREAEELGYFKLDILNVGIYKEVKGNEHLERLLATEPPWDLLGEKDFCDLLFHLRSHHAICAQMKPTNIEQLAAVLAMIRPAKRHLVGRSWDEVMREVWTKPEGDEYFFKKSHSFAYAKTVMLHMNIVAEKLLNDSM